MNNSQEINEGLMEYEDEKREKKNDLNKKKSDTQGLILSGVKSFVEYQLSQDIDFFNDKNLDLDKLYNNFLSYLKNNDEYYQLSTEVVNFGDKEKKILQEQIKKESINQRIGLDKNISSIKKIINKEFDIKDKNLLDQELKKLYQTKDGRQKLKKLLKGYEYRVSFLKKSLGDKNYEYKNDNSSDKNIDIKGLNIEELDEKQLEILKKMYVQKTELSASDIISFLGMLSQENAKAILEHFNPSLSVKNLLDNNIISERDLIKILKNDTNISEKEIKTALKNNFIDLDNIFLTIDDLNKDNIIKLLDNEEAVKTIVDELNKVRREFEKDQTKELFDLIELNSENNYEIHNQFINILKKDLKDKVASSVINSIDNFKVNNILKVKSKNSESYYEITGIDLGATKSGKHIKIKNLSSSSGGIKDPKYVEEEIMTYEDLYKLFKSAKDQDEVEVNFLNKNVYDLKDELGEAPAEENIKTEEQLKQLLVENGFLDNSLKDQKLTNLKFKDKEKGEEFYRTFKSVDDKKGELTFEGSNQVMKYNDFFAEFKRSGKYKLEKKINSVDELIEQNSFLKDNNIVLHKSGKKLVYKDDKDKDKDKIEGIKYIISGNGKAISIKNVDENNIEFAVGKFEVRDKVDKEGKKLKDTNGKNIKRKLLREKVVYKNINNLDYFDLILNQEGDYKIEDYDGNENIETKDNTIPFKEKGSFFSKWFSMASIAEVIQGGEMTVNAFKEFLERGNDLRAAKFAQLFGGILPNSVQAKLQFNTTEKRKEVVEKVFKQLTEMNSKEAVNYIKKDILENSYASKEEIFAAIRFMAEKRGNLYGKGFVGLEGTYMWAKKLGFDVNSSEFKEREKKKRGEIKNNVIGKKDPSNLIEEDLLENVVLKNLGKGGKVLYPRVEKDFNKYINAGQSNRYKKGEDETGAMHTVQEKTDNFVYQLKSGEKARSMAAMKKIMDKNSTIESIHFPGFLLSMSGYPKYFFPTEINHLLGTAVTTPSSSLLFSLTHSGIDTYQKAIIQFYKDKKEFGKAKKLEDIISNIDHTKGPKNHEKTIESLVEFWAENYKEIMDFVTLKDGHVIINKGKNKIYEKFYDTLKAYIDSGEFYITEGDFLATGQYEKSPVAEVGAKLGVIKVLNNGGLGDENSRGMLKVYINRLKEIKELTGITEEERKKLWIHVFSPFIEYIWKQTSALYGRSQNNEKIFKDMEVTSEIYKNNIILPIGEYSNFNVEDKDFIEKAYSYFMQNDFINDDNKELNNLQSKIPDAVNDIMGDDDSKKMVYKDKEDEPMNSIKI